MEFRRGTQDRPRGHALAYFETGDGRVLATYLVVPPIVIDLAKYMPPMFAGQFPSVSPQDVSAMPLPPVPEEIAGGVATLERLAELRDDDLIQCGRIDAGALDRLLIGATEAGAEYARIYRAWHERSPSVAIEETPSLDVDEVMRSLMGDHDRVAELAKLIGRLRYSIEVADPALEAETVVEMEEIGRHMADKYRAGEVIASARQRGPTGARLAELHVERCYKLATEEYAEVARIEAEIKRLALTEE